MSKNELAVAVSMIVSAIATLAIGGIGLERTFSAYARIDAGTFAVYLVMALAVIVVGIVVGYQSVMMIKHGKDETDEKVEGGR